MSSEDSNALPQIHEDGSTEKRPACRQCRARKVKCDRRQSGCVRCERLDLSCSYVNAGGAIAIPDDNDAGRELTQAGTKRRRTLQACNSCRATKAKCSGNYPCKRCESQGQDCVFPTVRPALRQDRVQDPLMSPVSTLAENRDSIGPSPATLTPQGINKREFDSESKSAVGDHIHAYFDNAEFIDCLFLHRASILADWSKGTLDKNLLKAICALGIRLVSADEVDPSCSAWVDEIQRDLMSRIGELSIPNLQTLMLVVHYRSTMKFTGDVWVLLSIAARVAFTKRLNYERLSGDAVKQESLRRLMWSIYRFDKIFSGGIEDLTICPSHRLHLRLPNSHRNFQLGLASRMQYLRDAGDSDSDMNVLAYLMRLFDVRDRILRYTRRVILDGSSPFPSRDQLRSLDQELVSFKHGLPEELKLDANRLMIMCHSEDARTYIVLHTFLYLCRCDLFRFLIPGIRESVSPEAMNQTPRAYIDYCQQRCLESAVWCCEFWSQVYHSETRRHIESGTLAIALYQCTKIIDHLYFLLPPEGGHSLPQLKEKLTKALSVASRTEQKLEWVGRCIADVEKLIPVLGTRPQQSDSLYVRGPIRSKHVANRRSTSSGVVTNQDKLHRRSMHAFAPDDEEETDPVINPLRSSTTEDRWAGAMSTPGGTAGSETWPFSMPEHGNETSAQARGSGLGPAQMYEQGIVQHDLMGPASHSFDERDFVFPMDPFDLHLNAYSDTNLPQFLGEIQE